MGKTPKMAEVEKRIGEPIEDFLKREYHGNLRSSAEIGRLLKITNATILLWLKRFGIERRQLSEAQSLFQKSRIKKPPVDDLTKLRDEGKSQSEIARIYNVNQATISAWLIRDGIRSKGYKRRGEPSNLKRPSKSSLEKLFLTDKKSTYEIANTIGATQASVSNWLNEYRIQTRDPTTAHLLSYGKEIEIPTPERLKDLYVSQKLSLVKLGELFGVATRTIQNWLINAGIQTRTLEKASQVRYHGIELEIPDRDTLSKLYLEDKLAAKKIGELVGVSENLILSRLKRAGIKRRARREAAFVSYGKQFQVLPKQKLEELYVRKRKTSTEIAEIYGVNRSTINSWLHKANIRVRGGSESKLVRSEKFFQIPSKQQLETLYIEKRKSSNEIGDLFGVSSSTVLFWLREMDMAIRDVSEAQLARFGKILKKPPKKKLREWYINEMMTTHDIADMVGVTHHTVREWLKKDGIELRDAIYNYQEWLNCLDGHQVRSGYERRVDDWLYLNGIFHRYDAKLPGERKFRCDFKVEDVFIEVYGMSGIKHYDEKTHEKNGYYLKYNLERIGIYPRDFDSKNSFAKKLEPLLKYSDPDLRKQRQIKEY